MIRRVFLASKAANVAVLRRMMPGIAVLIRFLGSDLGMAPEHIARMLASPFAQAGPGASRSGLSRNSDLLPYGHSSARSRTVSAQGPGDETLTG